MGAYAGSKAALWSFAQARARGTAAAENPGKRGEPQLIDTPTMGMTEASDEARAAFSKFGDAIKPMKRHGTPAEVAAAAMFLAFDATFTTGVKLPVDGASGRASRPPSD